MEAEMQGIVECEGLENKMFLDGKAMPQKIQSMGGTDKIFLGGGAAESNKETKTIC